MKRFLTLLLFIISINLSYSQSIIIGYDYIDEYKELVNASESYKNDVNNNPIYYIRYFLDYLRFVKQGNYIDGCTNHEVHEIELFNSYGAFPDGCTNITYHQNNHKTYKHNPTTFDFIYAVENFNDDYNKKISNSIVNVFEITHTDTDLEEYIPYIERRNNSIITNNKNTTLITLYNNTFIIHFNYNENEVSNLENYTINKLMFNIEYKTKIIDIISYELEKYPTNSLQYLPTEFYIVSDIINNDLQEKYNNYNGLNNADVIYLNCSNLYSIGKTLHHEIFHTFVNHTNFNAVEQQLKLIPTTNIPTNSNYSDGFVSAYSRTSAEEDMAEIFALLMIDGSNMNVSVIDYITTHLDSSITKKYKLLLTYIRSNISNKFNDDMFLNISNIK